MFYMFQDECNIIIVCRTPTWSVYPFMRNQYFANILEYWGSVMVPCWFCKGYWGSMRVPQLGFPDGYWGPVMVLQGLLRFRNGVARVLQGLLRFHEGPVRVLHWFCAGSTLVIEVLWGFHDDSVRVLQNFLKFHKVFIESSTTPT